MLSLVEVRDDALRQPAKAGAMTASLGAGESDMGTAAARGCARDKRLGEDVLCYCESRFGGARARRPSGGRGAIEPGGRGPRVSGVSGFVSAVACARPRV